MTIDLDDLLPEPEEISEEALAQLCEFLHDLADAIEKRHCGRPIARRRREYERQAIADARADELYPDHLEEDEPPF